MRILLVLFLFSTFYCSGQELPRYSCILDRTEMELWLVDTNRSFDDDNYGVILLNGYYHPVNICQYGLFCLDKYAETNDEEWLKKASGQVKYFQNKGLVHELFDGSGIGLPYNFEYKGLMPPWYSGMGQGMGVSFLLRYAEATRDTSLYPTVRKLIYVMLQPQEKGGCISKTPENLLWIEEYPNTPESPQVLNGGIFALFGLMDYCLVFPDDSSSQRILMELLSSLKTIIPTYDSRSWTKYNRRAIYPNRFDYIHLQIFQMRQLFQYTNDPFFLRQACIWSAMIQGRVKDDQKPSLHFNEQDISVPAKLLPEEIQIGNVGFEPDEWESAKVSNGVVNPLPWYAFTTTDEVVVSEPKLLEIQIDSTLNEVHMLYRYHWDEVYFESEKWQASNGVSSHSQTFHLEPGKYQFAIFVSTESGNQSVPVLKFEARNPE